MNLLKSAESLLSTSLQVHDLCGSSRRTWQSCPSDFSTQNLSCCPSGHDNSNPNVHQNRAAPSRDAKGRRFSSVTGTLNSPKRNCRDESEKDNGRPPVARSSIGFKYWKSPCMESHRFRDFCEVSTIQISQCRHEKSKSLQIVRASYYLLPP